MVLRECRASHAHWASQASLAPLGLTNDHLAGVIRELRQIRPAIVDLTRTLSLFEALQGANAGSDGRR